VAPKNAGNEKDRWSWYYVEAFIHIMNHHPRGSHWKVYCVLCNYRRWRGLHKDTCYPSYKTISQEAHISVDSVRRIVKDLKALGVITIKYAKVVDRKRKRIGRRRNIYGILQPDKFIK
jgi:hypothetical protein